MKYNEDMIRLGSNIILLDHCAIFYFQFIAFRSFQIMPGLGKKSLPQIKKVSLVRGKQQAPWKGTERLPNKTVYNEDSNDSIHAIVKITGYYYNDNGELILKVVDKHNNSWWADEVVGIRQIALVVHPELFDRMRIYWSIVLGW